MEPNYQAEIREVGESDLEKLDETLVDAFQQDPFFEWFVPQGRAHRRRLLILFMWFLQTALERGTILATPDLAATILIMPPGKWQLGIREQVAELQLGVRVFGVGRLLSRVAGIAALERRAPSRPHYYIPLLAADPKLRGLGVGSALLKEALRRADSKSVPTYLENTNELNLPFYQRLGFVTTETFRMIRQAPPMWLMVREPQNLDGGRSA
ncbi:GNAT family N-acetyltransferase [Candidatus Bipolaricaulota bacterium]